MKRTISRIVRRVLIAFIAFLGVLLGLLAWIVYHPDLLISDRALHWGSVIAERAGVPLNWSNSASDAHSLSLFRKRFVFRFDNFCVGRAKEGFHVCFAKARVEFVVDFSGFSPAISSLGPVRLTGGRGVVMSSDSGQNGPDEDKSESGPGTPQEWIASIIPGILRKAEWQRIWVEFNSLKLALGGDSYEAAARLSKRRTGAPGDPMVWDLRLFDLRSPYLTDANVRLRLANARGGWEGNWKVSGDIAGKIPGGGFAEFDLHGDQTGPQALSYELEGDYMERSRKLAARIKGSVAPNDLSISMLSADIEGWTGDLPRLSMNRCRFRARPENFFADCPVTLHLSSRQRIAGLKQLAIPAAPKIRIRADLKTVYPPDPAQSAEGSVFLDLEPASTDFLSGGATIRAKIAGVPTEFPRDWRLETEIEAELRLREFRKLVRALSRTDWAIPAPFNSMDGESVLAVSGNASLQEGRIPLRLATTLDSRGQNFDVEASGALSFDSQALQAGSFANISPHLDLNILLSDVRLVLPRLTLKSPPRVLPDSRIHRGADKAAKQNEQKVPFTYRIQVETRAGSPLQLVSNLSKGAVPINLRLLFTDRDPMQGYLRIANFPLKLFRRNAAVEHIAFEFFPREDTQLNGVLRVKYADYRVKVLLLGTLEDPKIQLTSDPPLPESDLLAALLFGRPLEELDPLQSESIGSARAALADSALNLASLYFLASTPIESFGYDPSSRLFSAKVRLGEGTSLNVGAESGELSQIGVRRRLSRFWTITTTIGGAQEKTSSVMAFLEWVNRY